MNKTVAFTAEESEALAYITVFAASPATFDVNALWSVAGVHGGPIDFGAPCFTVMEKLISVGLAKKEADGRYAIPERITDLKDGPYQKLLFGDNDDTSIPLTLTLDGQNITFGQYGPPAG